MRPPPCLALATLLCPVACGRDHPAPGGRAALATVSAVQDTVFAGTMTAVHRPRPGARPGILRVTRAVQHPRYDRIVFEFSGDSLPGYHVEYASRPVRRCGSGDPVSLVGAARLVVRFEPAQAHDEQGRSTVAEREWVPGAGGAPGLPAVKEMKLVCDFEGQVEWVLGVAAARPYRVTETGARLILDVGHGP